MTTYPTNNEEIASALSKDDLVAGLRRIGVTEGMILEVHCALHTFGYVIGGAQTMVDALIEAVGFEGTLVVPLQAVSDSEPAFWVNPPLQRRLWSKVRENIPAFDPDETGFSEMGEVAENLNRRPGAYRSYHPSCAFAAYGRYGKVITRGQSLDFALGEQSPLGVMYQLPSYVLLLGVEYDNCTAMHLGEYRSQVRPVILQGGAVEENGYRKWVKYLDEDIDSDEFPEIGKAMEKQGMVTIGRIGGATVKFFPLPQAVDFTADYLKRKYGG
jgi:aminoglycoside 3-N-acetyltransferase